MSKSKQLFQEVIQNDFCFEQKSMKIQNIKSYNTVMALSYFDKFFWLDKLDSTKWQDFVDYGCADGFLTKKIADIFPEKNICGFDYNAEMIGYANQDCNFENLYFTSVLPYSSDVVLLSSVLHEIYHYGDKAQIESFWNWLETAKPKYVIVRDMLNDLDGKPIINEWVVKVKNKYPKFVKDFEKKYGDINTERNFFHFLLKYSYKENWVRECAENYFACSLSEVEHKMKTLGYRVLHKDTTTSPYFKQKWERDFVFFVGDNYQIFSKLIFEKI